MKELLILIVLCAAAFYAGRMYEQSLQPESTRSGEWMNREAKRLNEPPKRVGY